MMHSRLTGKDDLRSSGNVWCRTPAAPPSRETGAVYLASTSKYLDIEKVVVLFRFASFLYLLRYSRPNPIYVRSKHNLPQLGYEK